ncbi:MAG TPA: winged helix-turn-helix domain-containing protein, partial [Flavisolibacter sp.]|nr:winged helix-turn-helix domain-containing protein [Flavisolibacter sp.]
DMFDEYGECREDFEILKSKKVCFSYVEEAEADEAVFIQEAFKTWDVTKTEQEIINLIKKDPKITPEVIAQAIGQTKKYVTSKLDSLVKRGIIETSTQTIGEDEEIIRTVPDAIDVIPPVEGTPPVQVMVKYSYEVKPGIGPAIIPTTRPFCRKMIQLNRLYSRAEIEAISLRLGYSVWDRKGGWWGKNPECRHRWVSNVVVKKK